MTAAQMPYSRSLAELRRDDEARFGGKSASLGELLAAGIPVPGGFALSTAAFQEFLKQSGLATEIGRRLASLSIDDVSSVAGACDAIATAIGAAPVPAGVEAQIGGGCTELARMSGDPAPPVAVRSSAIGEDSHTATFAGQQETFLWVRGAEEVTRAVRDCWASIYSPTAVSYRARLPAGGPAPAMGVAVQLMVDAEVSGVMFTCNPVSGDPSIVAINASWGLGEAVVAGEVTPDEYLLSKVTGELVRKRVGDKQVEHVPAPAGGGTVRREVAAERREEACLSEADLAVLLDLARRVERHFGSQQDIEWAIARGGGLFVLQSRPVTVVREQRRAPAGASAIALVIGTFGAGGTPGGA